MHWTDEGFLLSKNKYGENSIIAEVFTLNHGKCSGIVYGGTSRKIKSYLQLGNKINIVFKKKNENKIGYFSTEILDAISPYFFEDNKKINCLFSSLDLLKTLLPDSHVYSNIYFDYYNFLNELKFNEIWILKYIKWEINFLKEIGFDLNLVSKKNGKTANNDIFIKINIDNEIFNVPSFLISEKKENINSQSIYGALKFIGSFLEKKIFLPNKLNYPWSRKKLESFFYKQ